VCVVGPSARLSVCVSVCPSVLLSSNELRAEAAAIESTGQAVAEAQVCVRVWGCLYLYVCVCMCVCVRVCVCVCV